MCSIMAFIANAYTFGANFGFIYSLDMGFVGAPIARVTTHFFLCLMGILYVIIFKKYKETWGGLPACLFVCLFSFLLSSISISFFFFLS